MSDILLVHGSCHGAWCWRDLIPELAALGHDVRGMDMPSHGQDDTPLSEVTLESCTASVVNALAKDTVVVAHSWGGFPATLAADIAPEKLNRLIYLCAYVPRDGHSLVDMRKMAPRQPILKAVDRAADGTSYRVHADYAEEVFYADCPKSTIDYAIANLSPQATLPQATPAHLGAGHLDVPRSYIRTLYDNAIPTEFQAEMVAGWPRSDVYEMATSHSPFFADPKGLAALIDQITKD
ncbi:Pimeloyl-ACP methyl ester carboxylesterase [Shimia gijangensis]|uniref:Pimeloyl-ACP methyl ester carboxylesterase n=1 Tax=Shimia gijangensis TaxID=1470563 RepID=A0A1M6IHX3_9RHOB|nr:alpha/beta fold hydrolase [Shimia gijangensis]SHJ33986.1 Pimeloyl-ACP methyl ester carboxylesterase [Shimia gijangensis]